MLWSGSCIYYLLSNSVLLGLFIMFIGYAFQGFYMMYQNSKLTKSYK